MIISVRYHQLFPFFFSVGQFHSFNLLTFVVRNFFSKLINIDQQILNHSFHCVKGSVSLRSQKSISLIEFELSHEIFQYYQSYVTSSDYFSLLNRTKIVLWSLVRNGCQDSTICDKRTAKSFPKVKKCPWCNGYRRRKWTRRHEFKSWTRLIAFHRSTNTLGKGMNPAMGK